MPEDSDFKREMRGVKPLKATGKHFPQQVNAPRKQVNRQLNGRSNADSRDDSRDDLRANTRDDSRDNSRDVSMTKPNNHSNTAVMRNEAGAKALYFLKTGEQKKTLSRLKKAQFSGFDAEIDLHGYRAIEAEAMVRDFLNNCLANAAEYALIIHGRGLHSSGEPVIKKLCETLLLAHPYTVAYCSARPVDGGTGALYVQFRYPRPSFPRQR